MQSKAERHKRSVYSLLALALVLLVTSCLWACAPAREPGSGPGRESAGVPDREPGPGQARVAVAPALAKGESPADFARHFIAKPRFFGAKTAAKSIIVYTNPQCPPCKRLSETLRGLFPRLDPAETEVIVLGRGFFEQGTRLMYTATLLALQNQAMGRAFLADAMQAGAAPYVDGDRWLRDWLERSGYAGTFDEEAYLALAASEDMGRAYLAGVLALRQDYGLSSTPSLIINGRLYSGERSVEAILRALDAD